MDKEPRRPRVLIVDDAPAVGEVLGIKLEREGYLTVVARGIERASTLLERDEFDCILLDIRLPDGSGLEFLKHIRERRSALDTPVIMVSGLDETGDVVSALSQGANDYITKPFDLAVALARVRTQTTLRRLKEANDDFLHIAGNDLKRPLTSVLDVARQLYTNYLPGSALTEQYHKTLAGMIESAEQMREVITDVLELRALRDRRLRLQKLETDLGAIMRQAVAHSGAIAKIRGVELRMEFERDLPNIYADDARILQVLEILISNAVKVSPSGSVIAVRAKRDEYSVVCEVADKGRGVSEAQARLLTPGASITDASDAAGAGLLLVREIIALHGGEVGYRNNPDGGATCWFQLPMVESVYLA